MTKYKAIIVDDEAHCRSTLAKQIEWSCPQIEIVQQCAGAIEAIPQIQKYRPDLIFLDIEMPHMTGLEMLQEIPIIDFYVIFTTAYDEYALEAFKSYTLAYLLKPIDEDDLTAAISDLSLQIHPPWSRKMILSLIKEVQGELTSCKLVVPTQLGLEVIKINQVIRCEADSNYTTIFMTDERKILVSKTLKEIESKINDPTCFIRSHAKHLVNINFLKMFLKEDGGQLLLEDGSFIPVSKSKKQIILRKIQGL